MSGPRSSVVVRGDFVAGRWRLPAAPDGLLEKRSPADLDDEVGAFPWSVASVDDAVDAARRAQPDWEGTPTEDRLALIRKLKELLGARSDMLATAIAREVGKPFWEARAEVAALRTKIDVTLEEGLPLVAGFTKEHETLECRFRPHGVLAVLGPFNFPLHLPHGHVVPALALGNTVVFKPSEVAPLTAQLYAECVEAAGFPPGVFNLVQGAAASGAKLGAHPEVDGVLFTGSLAVGIELQRANLHRPGRLLALEMGGKNAALVLDDAPLDKALHDVLFSAFVTAGQRCTAVSRVVVTRSHADLFCEALVAGARRLVVGRWDDPGVFMGPLATEQARTKFMGGQAFAAEEERTETLLATTLPEGLPRGFYVTPAVHRVNERLATSAYQHDELFGPDVAVYVAHDTDEALAIANDSRFGLAASVFTRTRSIFEYCAGKLRAGCVGWSLPTVGATSRLPFGGVGDSGNHRPAALFSSMYCTWPQAIQRGPPDVDRSKDPPGFG